MLREEEEEGIITFGQNSFSLSQVQFIALYKVKYVGKPTEIHYFHYLFDSNFLLTFLHLDITMFLDDDDDDDDDDEEGEDDEEADADDSTSRGTKRKHDDEVEKSDDEEDA